MLSIFYSLYKILDSCSVHSQLIIAIPMYSSLWCALISFLIQHSASCMSPLTAFAKFWFDRTSTVRALGPRERRTHCSVLCLAKCFLTECRSYVWNKVRDRLLLICWSQLTWSLWTGESCQICFLRYSASIQAAIGNFEEAGSTLERNYEKWDFFQLRILKGKKKNQSFSYSFNQQSMHFPN